MEFGDRSSHTGWLHGIEKFEGEIENFIFNTVIYFKPVNRFENRSGRVV